MKNIILYCVLAFSLLLTMPAKAVKPVVENETSTLVIDQESEESTNIFLRQIEIIKSSTILDNIKPKKKKRKKKKKKKSKRSRLQTFLYGTIFSGVGAVAAYVVAYAIVIISFADAAFLLAFLLLVGAGVLSIISMIFFILWMIELTSILDNLE